MEKNDGFTLIELLAVIVVLAIILVIAVPSVTSAINVSRNRAFIESYKGILDEVKTRIIQKKLDRSIEVECADTTDDLKEKFSSLKSCHSIYDISEDEYSLYVLSEEDVYFVILEGNGKFSNVDYEKNKSELRGEYFYPFDHRLSLPIDENN